VAAHDRRRVSLGADLPLCIGGEHNRIACPESQPFALRVDGKGSAMRGPQLLGIEDVHRTGSYRAKPSRRAFIPKPDGRLRPLGIAALEDKILQRALVEVLNAIYEADFLGFSAG
jgi:hypothetical protein